jgi:hypothetical protein
VKSAKSADLFMGHRSAQIFTDFSLLPVLICGTPVNRFCETSWNPIIGEMASQIPLGKHLTGQVCRKFIIH